VGKLDPKLVRGIFTVGTGGSSPADVRNLAEFLKALTGTLVKNITAIELPE
jgi:hypothetical protein